MYLSSSIEGPQKLCLKKKPTKWLFNCFDWSSTFLPNLFSSLQSLLQKQIKRTPVWRLITHSQPLHLNRPSSYLHAVVPPKAIQHPHGQWPPEGEPVSTVPRESWASLFKDAQGEHVVAFGNSFDGFFLGTWNVKKGNPGKWHLMTLTVLVLENFMYHLN